MHAAAAENRNYSMCLHVCFLQALCKTWWQEREEFPWPGVWVQWCLSPCLGNSSCSPAPTTVPVPASLLSHHPSLCLLQRSPGIFCQYFPVKHPTQCWKHPKSRSGHHPFSAPSCVGLHGVWPSPLPEQQLIRVIPEPQRKRLQKPRPVQNIRQHREVSADSPKSIS